MNKTKEQMKILITNDDGISEDGIIRLARAAKKYGQVWVVAPDSQRSGASHNINLHTPIQVRKVDFPVEGIEAYETTGSPADCVRVGVLNIVPDKPDVVLTGINYGYNAGSDVMYSGTIGAAMEAAFQKIHAIAFSEGTTESSHITAKYIEEILDEVIHQEHHPDQIININFPSCKMDEFKGVLRERFVSKSCIYKDHYVCTEISDTVKNYMVEGDYNEDAEEGSDLQALFDNYISIGVVNNLY